MCLQDVQIDRGTKSGLKTVSLTADQSQQVVSAAPGRLVLIFGAPSSGTVWLAPDEENTVGRGIPIASGDPPFKLSQGQGDGDLPTRAWSAIVTGASPTISAIEGINATTAKQADSSG